MTMADYINLIQRESQKKEDIFATLPGLHYSDSADVS
jgi:hypothetical protein